MNRRFFLTGVSAVALAGCSMDITIELPRIQGIAARFTAWIVSKFAWAAAVIQPIVDKNAEIQKLSPSQGWGPILRMALSDFVDVARMALKGIGLVAPIPAAYMNLASNILTALSGWISATGPARAGLAAGAEPNALTLADAESSLQMLEMSQ